MSEHEPRIDSIRYFYTSGDKRSQVGDRRVTKKHGLQIRIHVRAKDWQGKPIGYLVRSGRPVLEWCAPKDLPVWDQHLLTPEERESVRMKNSS